MPHNVVHCTKYILGCQNMNSSARGILELSRKRSTEKSENKVSQIQVIRII